MNTRRHIVGCFNSLIKPEHLCYFHSNIDIHSEEDNKEKMVGQLTLAQRKAKIKRYKEKNRLWNKEIRYTARKENAQKKLRIKGRFVSHNKEHIEEYYKYEIPILDNTMFSIKRIKSTLCPTSHLLYHSSC